MDYYLVMLNCETIDIVCFGSSDLTEAQMKVDDVIENPDIYVKKMSEVFGKTISYAIPDYVYILKLQNGMPKYHKDLAENYWPTS